MTECMFMGQRYEMGVIYVTHVLSGTSPIIRQNAQTIIVTSLPGESPRLICDTLGVTAEMADKMKTFRPGEFAILNPALWEKCVYATFDKLQIPGKLDESERRRAVEGFLNRIKACGPAPLSVVRRLSAGTAGGHDGSGIQHNLTSLQLETLVLIATGIPEPACELYSTKGLSRSQGWRITKGLESFGLIVPHFLSTGKRGGQLCFYDVTDHGWQVLTKMGIARPKALTNGSFIHELAARLIESWEKRRSRIVRFEVTVDNHRLDCESIDKASGEKTFFNIGTTDPVREAANIEEIVELPAVKMRKFVFVARDKEFASEVKKALEAKDPTGKVLGCLELKAIADFVER